MFNDLYFYTHTIVCFGMLYFSLLGFIFWYFFSLNGVLLFDFSYLVLSYSVFLVLF